MEVVSVSEARNRSSTTRRLSAALAFTALIAAPPPALALDGCLVLLCLAAPSWRAIPQCVAPITQLLRDLARGKLFPTCDMSGPGNTAGHQWASAPSFCPPQYTRSYEGESQTHTRGQTHARLVGYALRRRLRRLACRAAAGPCADP